MSKFKRSSPSREACGTPAITTSDELVLLYMATFCFLLLKYLYNIFKALAEKPQALNFTQRRSWFIVSKALERSKYNLLYQQLDSVFLTLQQCKVDFHVIFEIQLHNLRFYLPCMYLSVCDSHKDLGHVWQQACWSVVLLLQRVELFMYQHNF